MSAAPWRGTLIFAGGIAAIAATVGARFAGADVAAGQAGAAPAGSEASGAASGSSSGSATSGSGSSGTSDGSSSSSSAADPAATPSTAPATTGGTVTIVGSTVQTRFGPVQVSVTFDGSDITAVQALQTPSWHGESVQINAYAVPILEQEAVTADSANIDSVSGATVTSDAYKQSLQAAIDQHG